MVPGSGNCYRLIEDTVDGDKMSWENAEEHCKEDNAMLACFNTENERNVLAQWCHDNNGGYGCWVGYKYTDAEGEIIYKRDGITAIY